MEGTEEISTASFLWRNYYGNWFVTTADGNMRDAFAIELETPRDESLHARHVTSAEPVGAADLWAELVHPWRFAYDLSEYAGIAFWARSDTAGGVDVDIGFNHLGRYIGDASASALYNIEVTEEWQEFIVLFEDVGVDGSTLVSFDFVVGEDGQPYDLWLDDVTLACAGSCPVGE